jgi:hypothetical protein
MRSDVGPVANNDSDEAFGSVTLGNFINRSFLWGKVTRA